MNKLVNIGNTQLNVRIIGEGFPVIVLHGGPGLDMNFFGDYLDPLSKNYQLIFVDQRGHGLSKEEPFITINTKQLSKDVLTLTQALGIKEYALLGHSYGAFVSLQFAVDYPEKAKYIVLLNGIDGYKRMAEYKDKPIEMPDEILKAQQKYYSMLSKAENIQEYNEALQELMPLYFAYPTNYELLQEYASKTTKLLFKADMLYDQERSKLDNFDVTNELHKVKSKVLIVTGEQDRLCRPYVSEEIHKKIKDSTLVLFKGCGHMPFVERTKELLEAIVNFIKE